MFCSRRGHRVPPTRGSRSCSTSPSAQSPRTSTATSSSTSAASSTTASGSARNRRFRTPAASGRRSSITCGACRPGAIRWPGGCFADSYDWRDGVGARARGPTRTNFWVDDRDGEAPGRTVEVRSEPLRHERVHRASAGWPAASRISRPICAACRRGISTSGSSTATARRAATTLAELRAAAAIAIRSRSATGASATNRGAAAATSRRRSTRPNTAASPRGCRATASTSRFIGSGPNGGDLGWTRRFFAKLAEKGEGALGGMWGWALHHYSWNASRGATTDWDAGQGRCASSSRTTSGTSC